MKANLSAPQAVVFDFDGVLVNTEPLHLRATQEALALHGIVLTEVDYYAKYVGYDDAEMFAEVAKDQGVTWSSEDFRELIASKAWRFEALEKETPLLVPGADNCVRRLAEISPLAIASGARRDEIERILHRVHLSSYFRVIVAAGETVSGKPAPDPYRAVLDRLDAKPARTIAIEDTAAGLASAKAAGLRCIGVTTTFPASKLSLADRVVDSLDDVTPGLVRELVET
jgi:HAD superfamily hydrolase (TIGR01509 family)